MTFKVRLRPSGREFEVAEGQSILGAGLASGCNMPYSCRSGVCRTCRGRIIEGKVDFGAVHPTYLTENQKQQGVALLCQAKPLSDLVIDVEELSLHAIKPKAFPCRVVGFSKPAPDVALLELRLPMNQSLVHFAGQYVDMLLATGERRSYSIATAPEQGGVTRIELHVRHSPGGLFTDHVFSTMKERDILRFEGPLGTFYLREDNVHPVILLATGTGFAPIKAIIEHAVKRNIKRPMTLYWGGRTRRDLYLYDLAMSWQEQIPGFRFIPVLSEPLPGDQWTGRTGLVHREIMKDLPDMSGHQVYACGAPIVIDSARRDFSVECRLPEQHHFFADSFITAAERTAGSLEQRSI